MITMKLNVIKRDGSIVAFDKITTLVPPALTTEDEHIKPNTDPFIPAFKPALP